MNTTLVVILVFISVRSVISQPQRSNMDGQSIITHQEDIPLTVLPDGAQFYKYSYETSNQIKARQVGNFDQNGENLSVEGFYSYVDPSGMPRFVFYVADKNGYRIKTGGIPVIPPRKPPPLAGAPTALLLSLQGGGFG